MRRGYIALAITVMTLTACGSLAYHRVRDGDTLYSIGWQYGYDYRTLAKWNQIEPPYVIKPGEWLRITPPEGAPSVQRVARTPEVVDAGAAPPPQPPSNINQRRPPAAASKSIAWSWPARGILLVGFSPHRPMGQGLDIAGDPGEPVRAAASGRVVYSGDGLKGYGNLIIIKHNEHYLSAYAYNRRILVKEGDHVSRGEEIAEMGDSGTNRVELHFEIRRDGDPVDPLDYLPGSGAR